MSDQPTPPVGGPTPPVGGPTPSALGDDTGRPLPGDETAERRRLPTRAVDYWRIHALAVGVPLVAVGSFGALALDWFTAPIRWVIVGALAGYWLVFQLVLAPPIRRRVFWYAISEDEIDLQHGLVVRTRTVIPMSRVQHLRMEHGPIADRFRLATLHIHTAAGSIQMHALDAGEADSVRIRIGRLAGLADDV